MRARPAGVSKPRDFLDRTILDRNIWSGLFWTGLFWTGLFWTPCHEAKVCVTVGVVERLAHPRRLGSPDGALKNPGGWHINANAGVNQLICLHEQLVMPATA